MADEQTVDTQNPDANQAPEASGEDLAARVQVLEEQLAGAQDQALRVAADLQNVRRRAEQDVEKAHKFALEKFAGDLLPIIDSLERGLESADVDVIERRGLRVPGADQRRRMNNRIDPRRGLPYGSPVADVAVNRQPRKSGC